MSAISLSTVASMIGVSDATVRNWVRAGYLVPTIQRPLSFRETDALKLKSEIESGSVKRLRSRANKVSSTLVATPKEYCTTPTSVEVIRQIARIAAENKLTEGETLYVAAVRLLVITGEIERRIGAPIRDPDTSFVCRRTIVKTELQAWYTASVNSQRHGVYETVYSAIPSALDDDFLGFLYQSLATVGNRSDRGSYYTPTAVVESALRERDFTKGSFLDPCCGTGKFLLVASRIFDIHPSQLHGVDSDPLAVRIARINILQAHPEYGSAPDVRCLDALTEYATGAMYCDTNQMRASIDFIATNPPWGATRRSNTDLATHAPGPQDAFALFLFKALDLLCDGGQLSFLLPESFLNVKAHGAVRAFLLENSSLTRIVRLGRVFSGVLSKVVRLDLVKRTPPKDWYVNIQGPNRQSTRVKQQRFSANPACTFDIELSDSEEDLLNKLYSTDHTTLAGNAEWALGVVTGDNQKHISAIARPGMEPIYKGSDVQKYTLGSPQSYLYYEPDRFQQVARNGLYRKPEKLIYRFISNKFVFAYDDKQSLTLNSANILVPSLPGISVKGALAILNSSVAQFIFQKRFATTKVLRGDLERLPFPTRGAILIEELERLVDGVRAGTKQHEELDDIVFECFSLSSDEAEVIRQSVGASNGTAKRQVDVASRRAGGRTARAGHWTAGELVLCLSV